MEGVVKRRMRKIAAIQPEDACRHLPNII
jgi:hypothetical protein